MILHLLNDNIFSDRVIEHFSKLYPDSTIFVTFSKNLKNIQNKSHVLFVDEEKFIQLTQEHKRLIIYSLFGSNNNKVILKLDRSVRIAVSIFGGELYTNFFVRSKFDLFEPRTLDFLKKEDYKKPIYSYGILFKIYNFFFKVKNNSNFIFYQTKRICERADYILTIIPTEQLVFSRLFKGKKYFQFSYGSIQDLLATIKQEDVPTHHRIVIGNSATYTNNHLDVFDKIQSTKYQVSCPLNYGNSEYASIIKSKGYELFGEQFLPLETYLPFEKYVSLLRGSRVLIINTIRQQAVHNIMLGLFFGLKVFLNKNSVVYKFLLDKGFSVYTTDVLDEGDEVFKSLFPEEKVNNRMKIEEIWGTKAIEKNTQKFVQSFLNN